MKKKILSALRVLIVYGLIPVQCFILTRAEISIIYCFKNLNYYYVFAILLVVFMGYNTVSALFTKYAIQLKRWALPLAALAFAPFLAAYYYLFPNFPQITNIGFYLSSIFIGMWLWADTKGEEQKSLFKETDYEQLSAIYFRELSGIPIAPKELPQQLSERRSDVDVRFLEDKYLDCDKALLRYTKGEIEFPGAFIITPSQMKDKIALIMKVRKGEPQMPHIYCNGSNNAIMTYDDNRTIGLCNISEEACHILPNYESICVYEVEINKDDEKLVRSYFAPITYVSAEVKKFKSLKHAA